MIFRNDLSNKEKVEILSREKLLDGFFHVQKFMLRHTREDDTWTTAMERLVLMRPDAVCAVVHHVERDAVLLVRQFRAGVHQKDHGWMTECAAGLVDEGEQPVEALRREILEELGYVVKEARFIKKIYTSPAIISERIWLYYVRVKDTDLAEQGGGTDEHEELEIVELALQRIPEYLRMDETMDAKTIIGLQWFYRTYIQRSQTDLL